jgi:hypothetical protein
VKMNYRSWCYNCFMTEQVSGEIPASEYEYQSEQQKILDRLKVGDLEEVLPEDLRSIYYQYQDLTGERRVKHKKNEVLVSADNNGIFTLRELQKFRVGFLPLPSSFRMVERFYYIDSINRKAWDVSQLWKAFEKEHYAESEDGKKEPFKLFHLYHKGGWRSSAFGYSLESKVGVLMLNRFLENPFIRRMKYPTSRIFRSLDHIAPPHEAGHFTQVDPEEFSRSKWELIKMSIGLRFYSSIVNSRVLTKVASIVPNIRRGLENFKKDKVERERNANAFGLATIRRLKQQGLDVFRGIPSKDVVNAVNYALQTYDQKFAVISGSKFSKIDTDLVSDVGREGAYAMTDLEKQFDRQRKKVQPEPT